MWAEQAQAAGGVGEYPNDIGSPPDFLIEEFEHDGAFHVLVMPAWQQVEGEGLLDRIPGPVGEPGIFGAPSGQPLVESGAGLGEAAPGVKPEPIPIGRA